MCPFSGDGWLFSVEPTSKWADESLVVTLFSPALIFQGWSVIVFVPHTFFSHNSKFQHQNEQQTQVIKFHMARFGIQGSWNSLVGIASTTLFRYAKRCWLQMSSPNPCILKIDMRMAF